VPLLIYALIAALLGWSIHKRHWGVSAFALSLLIWLLLMQCIIAYSLHSAPIPN
jgi:hypothetical protein